MDTLGGCLTWELDSPKDIAASLMFFQPGTDFCFHSVDGFSLTDCPACPSLNQFFVS